MWQSIAISVGSALAKILYSAFRGKLKKAIDDPDNDWDEKMMETADTILGHK